MRERRGPRIAVPPARMNLVHLGSLTRSRTFSPYPCHASELRPARSRSGRPRRRQAPRTGSPARTPESAESRPAASLSGFGLGVPRYSARVPDDARLARGTRESALSRLKRGPRRGTVRDAEC
eukprot:7378674-Prymnesium_polylepis.1